MQVIKIVLFLYASISPVFPSDSARHLYHGPTLINDNNCICYPSNQVYTTVPEILDPSNIGLERLVIYIYKDVNTHEIKMYTPNARKQSVIPDLPLEIGDGLIAVNKELAHVIFDKNPNRIVLNKVDNTIRDTKVQMPIGLEVGNVEEVNHESIKSIIAPKLIVEDIEATPQEDLIVTPKRVVEEISDNVSSGSGINHADTHFKMRPNAKRLHKAVQNEKWQGNAHENFWYRPGKHWTTNSETLPIHHHNIFEINSNGKVKHNAKTEIIKPNFKNVIPLTGPATLRQDQILVDQTQYLTFDKWFVQQMKSFHNINLPSDIDSISTVAIRSLIQETLMANNMYVTTDGRLTDSYGAALDAANLELRPMLLGNPVEYGNDNSNMPKDLPYLEGILVTLINPPKVLGIIPLGKTTLSQVSGRKEIKQAGVRINAVTKTHPNVANQLPNKITLDKEPIASLFADSSHRVDIQSTVSNKMPERPVIKHEYVPVKEKTKNEKHGLKKPNKSKLKRIPDDFKADNDVGSEINQNQSKGLITGKFLSKFYEMLSKSRPGDVEESDDNDDDETHSEEQPNYRIIGGYAATSSGAPVSNKGRSGNNV